LSTKHPVSWDANKRYAKLKLQELESGAGFQNKGIDTLHARLAGYLVDKSGYNGIQGRRFLDPACGSGTFLVQALDRQSAVDSLGLSV